MNRREFLRTGTGVLATAGFAGCVSVSTSGGGDVKNIRAASKAVQDAKRAKLAALKELGPTITDFEIRRKKNIPGRRAAFYIDDAIFCMHDLVDTKPKSCWDHPFFAHIKEAWLRYGMKTQLNLFYRDDFYYGVKQGLFSLKDVPETWKEDFQAAKEWFRFGFHSIQEYPDYPWISASYEDVALAWKMITDEVERFAGPGMFAKAVTPHWGPMSKEGCIALRDCGAKVVWVSRGKRWEYNGDRSLLPYGHGYRIENHRKPESAIYWRGGGGDDISVSACGYNHLDEEQVEKTRGTYNSIYDKATGINFKAFGVGGTCLNLYELKDIERCFEKAYASVAGGPEFFIHATHEEYFFKHYFMYQPDYVKKTFAAGKWMSEHGYKYCFIEDSVD